MPSAATVFRACCVRFSWIYQAFMLKRARTKKNLYVAIVKLRRRSDGVALGLLLSYLFWGSLLLRCGDVESNQGPNSSQGKDSSRQARPKSGGSRASMDRADNPSGRVPSEAVNEPTLSDVGGMIQDMGSRMDTRFVEVKEDLHVLQEEYGAMQEALRALRGEVTGLRQQNEDLQRKNEDLTRRLDVLESKADDLEGRSKRNNLIFYGLPRKDNETPADCEGTVKDLIRNKLELSEDIQFNRVHRINSKPDSPVMARCVFYKQKTSVLKAKGKLRGTNVFVGEDFSAQVREVRRRLMPHLKRARGEGKRASMVFNHLLIDGKKFTVDRADRLVELRQGDGRPTVYPGNPIISVKRTTF